MKNIRPLIFDIKRVQDILCSDFTLVFGVKYQNNLVKSFLENAESTNQYFGWPKLGPPIINVNNGILGGTHQNEPQSGIEADVIRMSANMSGMGTMLGFESSLFWNSEEMNSKKCTP